MARRVLFVGLSMALLISTSAFAQVGLTLRGMVNYALLLKPEIEEMGMPEEKLSKGGFGISVQALYRLQKIVSIGAEVGYLPCWKDEFVEPYFDSNVEAGVSAVPVLGVVQLEVPAPALSLFLQGGLGIYPLTVKAVVLGLEVEDTETEFGLMAAAGFGIPIGPKLNLDLGGKLHIIFTEGESTFMFVPGAGISVRF